MLKGYVTNLGRYNEGYLIGKWVSFPISDAEFNKALKSIGVSEQPSVDGMIYDEYFITDYETDIKGFDLGEYEDLETLNAVAEIFDNLDEYEQEAFQAMLEDGYDRFDAIEKVRNGEYVFYADCQDMEAVAMEYCDSCGVLDNVPAILQNYFDFSAYGRDMALEGNFVFIDGDCVEIL
ncbi:MAG: antirestriction protein ArdA [Prevotella sp.]|nr:antirestriction protein ArdA [Prevotella sp.]